MGKTIYASNFPWFDKRQIRETFEDLGPVISITFHDSQEEARVEMENEEDADAAMDFLNSKEDGIRVKETTRLHYD